MGSRSYSTDFVLTPLEQRVVDAVDFDSLLALLSDLISLPSVANNENPAQERMAEAMEDIGLSTDVWQIDFTQLKGHPAFTTDVERNEGLGVVGTMGHAAEEGRTLILNGHVDVVPAGEEDRWKHPPFELTAEGDDLYGRGVVDMKGPICCGLFAAKAILDAGVELTGELQIQSVIGEEDGGSGTLATIERGYRGTGAIVLEPTEFTIAPAQAGALSFRVTIPGLAAHGAFREEGVDPVEKFIPIFKCLRKLEADRNAAVEDPLFDGDALPFPLAMGRIYSGIWPSTVAETLVAEGRYGVAPGENASRARNQLEMAVAEAASSDAWLREHPPRVEWWGAQFESAQIAVDDPVVTTLSETMRSVTGTEPTIAGVRYGADMRLLVNEGKIPTVLFGPGDVREAHRPDEKISKDALMEATKILAVTALRFSGAAESDHT